LLMYVDKPPECFLLRTPRTRQKRLRGLGFKTVGRLGNAENLALPPPIWKSPIGMTWLHDGFFQCSVPPWEKGLPSEHKVFDTVANRPSARSRRSVKLGFR